MGDIANLIFSDEASDSIKKGLKQIDAEKELELNETLLEDYYYFFNGWPCIMTKQKTTDILNKRKIKAKRIECLSGSWNNWANETTKPEDAKPL